MSAAELPGCARLELAQGVVPLNPQEAMFEGMLAGWAPKRHRPIDAEASTMSRYMTSMYGLCDASGHRRQLCVTPLVRHAAPPAPLVDSVKPE